MGYNGRGVALSILLGQMLADLSRGEAVATRPLTDPLQPIPFHAFRLPGNLGFSRGVPESGLTAHSAAADFRGFHFIAPNALKRSVHKQRDTRSSAFFHFVLPITEHWNFFSLKARQRATRRSCRSRRLL